MKSKGNESEQIIIQDEEGNELDYIVDAIIKMNGQEYVLFSNENQVELKRLEEENGEQVLLDVTDTELALVLNAFNNK